LSGGDIVTYRVCLDAGHGGPDSGAVGPSGIKEKDITLAVCKYIKSLLEATGQIEVVMTRDGDYMPGGGSSDEGLYYRCRIAKQNGCTLFVAVHCNAGSSTARGCETYCLGHGGKSEKLAKLVQARLVKEMGLTDRGVKYANYYVLRHLDPEMPTILTELAFISNPAEEKVLNSADNQQRFARAIASAIVEYLNIKVVDSVFKDISGHWAEQSILRLAKLGLISGDANGNFNPDAPLTRAQVAVLLDRLLKLLGK